ncbi:alpha/beta hydrolase [Actinomadura graeca]|uniref:Alpha/beta hydrolase n=1 Tax=Actinomadura graeca TaxID=2750812 RepID=A0ABX8QST9_9ACTN|nr:alpha/beta hydrolase [Actinomadura graeca]QXJ21860.1 alpha/beta hydrolase [Actinomadura graeca]
MYDGFEEFDVATAETTVHGVRGGSGPPVLLLHGIPETHLMWHKVAPLLAGDLTVVATDLRGFGGSGVPPSAPDHAPYSMRRIARDQVEAMRALGHDRFAVVGHDRGARCAYRMALDHPSAVTRMAVLDVVPTGDAWDRAGKEFALGFWVWSFLAAPEPVPERLIAREPELIVDHMLDSWSDVPDAFPAPVRAAYTETFRDPARVHAVCEEYRAAATLDHEHDEADRGRRRVECPALALWSRTGAVAAWYDPLEIWRAWCDDVRGASIQAGHFFPEEAPGETARHLLGFLT